MRRDRLYVLILWVGLTAVGEVWAFNADFFPVALAEEAIHIDEAFRLLMILAVPVAALVLAMLGYSVVRFRVRDPEASKEGPALRSHRPLAISWLVVTTALAVLVVFNPGLKGMNALSAGGDAELVIQIEGQQWHWNVTYPQHDLHYERALQIAIPVDRRVKFEITSADVIHSFWIPAFRMKMDAVPGRTTTLYVTPTEVGSFDNEPNLRVQCAELCGTGHPRMQMAVHVLEPDEFDHWLEEGRSMTGAGMEMDMEMDEDTSMDEEMEMEMDEDASMEGEMDMNMGEDAEQ